MPQPKPKIEKPRYKRAPWTVVAPDGFRFRDNETHILCSAWTRDEAEELARTEELEPCPADCECRDED